MDEDALLSERKEEDGDDSGGSEERLDRDRSQRVDEMSSERKKGVGSILTKRKARTKRVESHLPSSDSRLSTSNPSP